MRLVVAIVIATTAVLARPRAAAAQFQADRSVGVPVQMGLSLASSWPVESPTAIAPVAATANPGAGGRAARVVLIGAAAGALLGAGVGLAVCDDCDDAAPLLLTSGVGALLGAFVGLIVNGVREDRRSATRFTPPAKC